jgi:periplasmic protein TonB
MFTTIEACGGHGKRHWTALAGFSLEFAALGALLVIPLIYPRTLSEAFTRRPIFLPIQSESPRSRLGSETAHPGGMHIEPVLVVSRAFTFKPRRGETSASETVTPPVLDQLLGGSYGVRSSIMAEVVNPKLGSISPPQARRRSVIMEGNLLYRVAPQYPWLAQRIGIQGRVRIKAVISRAGTIEQAEVVSGHALLAGAALAAVRQWKYRPYYLNAEAIEVETEITVNFVLHR